MDHLQPPSEVKTRPARVRDPLLVEDTKGKIVDAISFIYPIPTKGITPTKGPRDTPKTRDTPMTRRPKSSYRKPQEHGGQRAHNWASFREEGNPQQPSSPALRTINAPSNSHTFSTQPGVTRTPLPQPPQFPPLQMFAMPISYPTGTQGYTPHFISPVQPTPTQRDPE